MRDAIALFKANFNEYLLVIIFAFGSGLILLLQLYFHEVFHFSVVQASILLGSAGAGQLFGSFLANAFVRAISRALALLGTQKISAVRFSVVIVAFASAVLFMLFSMTNQYGSFLILSFFLGVSLSLFYPIIQAVLFEGKDLQQSVGVSSLKRWSLNIGVALSLTMISFMTRSPHILFTCIAGLMFLAMVISCCKLGQASIFDKKEISKTGDFRFHLSPPVAMWLLGVFIGYYIFFQVISTYAVYLHVYYHVDSSVFSRLMLINVFMVLVFQFVAPLLEKRMSIHAISALGVVLMGLGISMIVFHSPVLVPVSFVIWSVGEIFFMGMTPVYIKIFSQGNEESSLKYSSYYFTAFYLAKMVGPMIGSYCYEGLHMPKATLIAIFIIALFMGKGFLHLGRLLRQSK